MSALDALSHCSSIRNYRYSSLLLAAAGAILFLAPLMARADGLTDIRRLLSTNSVICANFTQKKLLRALTRPLVSTGRLLFVAGKGVLWEVVEPFPARVLVKKDALVKWNDDGSVQQLSLGQAPIFRALSQVFLAMFTGDLKGLQGTFKIDTNVLGSRWQLVLVPRDTAIAAIIASVTVKGGRFVDELDIEEGRGDHTQIQFDGTSTESCGLSVTEKGYFEQ